MEDIILRYLDKEMGPDEQEAFEKRLDQEPELAQLMEEEIRARAVVTASAYLDRKARLKARPITETAEVKPLFARPMVWAIAAVVAVLLAFAGLQLMNQPLSNEDLFAQNYQTVPFQTGVRGGDEDRLLHAREAYQKGDYEQAIVLLEVLLRDSSFLLKPKAYYFQGLSHLEKNDPAAAIQALDQVAEGSIFGPAARWHIALAHLKMDNREEAKKALQQLLNGPVQTYQAQARVLLKSFD